MIYFNEERAENIHFSPKLIAIWISRVLDDLKFIAENPNSVRNPLRKNQSAYEISASQTPK